MIYRTYVNVNRENPVLIKQVILGLLSETSLTGYDLKKQISSSAMLPWSGNSNQIYKALLELHQEGLVTVEEHQQSGKPPRKVYSLTAQGTQALRVWQESTPPVAQFHAPLLIQLLWAQRGETSTLGAMLEAYAEDVRVHIAMLQEELRRQIDTAQEVQHNSFARHAMQHWIDLYEVHLQWVRQLQMGLTQEGENIK